jgi:hypothetical protein
MKMSPCVVAKGKIYRTWEKKMGGQTWPPRDSSDLLLLTQLEVRPNNGLSVSFAQFLNIERNVISL